MSRFLPRYARFAAAALLGLLVVMYAGCSPKEEATEETEYHPVVSVQAVGNGLVRNFTTTGEVEANESANITTEFKATVIDVHAKAGEKVTAGQKLVTLSSDSVSERYSTANVSYATALQSLQQTKITGQRSVEQAEIALRTERVNLEELLKQNAARKKQAEESLNAAKLNLNLSTAASETELNNMLRTVESTVQAALASIDALLEYSEEYKDFDYIKEIHIGAHDPAQKVKTRESLTNAYNAFASYRISDEQYDEAIFVLGETEIALMMTYEMLQNSTTSPVDYPQSQLTADVSTINGHLATVRSTISQLESAKKALDRTKQEVSKGKSQTLIDAEAAYETTMAELDASEKRARLAVEQAEKALESAKASATASEIGARSQLAAASGEREQAGINQNDLVVEAPFEGVVAQLSLRKGQELQPGTLIVAIENDDLLKITTYVSAEEVRSIAQGDIVQVGEGTQARISSVAPSADPSSKKYKVELVLRSDVLQAGEFVTLQFQSEKKENTNDKIFLPVSAVHVSAAETFVWIAVEEDDQIIAKKQPITIGDVSGKFVEVNDGLKTGVSVITEGGRNIESEGTIVQIDNEQLTIDN